MTMMQDKYGIIFRQNGILCATVRGAHASFPAAHYTYPMRSAFHWLVGMGCTGLELIR